MENNTSYTKTYSQQEVADLKYDTTVLIDGIEFWFRGARGRSLKLADANTYARSFYVVPEGEKVTVVKYHFAQIVFKREGVYGYGIGVN